VNSLIYRPLFYANIYGSYKLSKTVRFFGPTMYVCVYTLTGNMLMDVFAIISAVMSAANITLIEH